jgi:hypothetical protein
MKYIKSYQEHNEGLKSTLAGVGLAATLLGSPSAKSREINTYQYFQNQPDGTIVYNQVSKLSSIRNEKVKDTELIQILDEIKSNVSSTDTSKYLELFNKLSTHLEDKYGYKFEQRNIDELDEASIGELKVGKDEMSLFAILGWLGSICLAICGVPQAWMSYKEKHSHGISWAFLLLWAFGEVFALAYVYDKLDLPLLLNYSVNILILAVILYFKVSPKVEMNPDVKPRSGH